MGSAASPAGSIHATQSTRVSEIINRGIMTFLPTLSPVWRNNIITSQGVGSMSGVGRDLKILKVFMGSFAGVFEPGGPKLDFPLYGDPAAGSNATVGNTLNLQNVSQVFPNPLEGPFSQPNRLGIGMRSMVANLAITLGEMTADDLDALVGQILAPKYEGFARLIAHTMCNYWYLNQNSNYALCNVATANVVTNSWDVGTTTWTFTFTPSNLAIDRFFPGQRLDFYSSANSLLNTNGGRFAVYVTSVDELKCRVTCKSANLNGFAGSPAAVPADITGTVTTQAATGTGIQVVYANSAGASGTPWSATSPYFTGIAGINSWLKGGSGGNDNYLLGDERDTSNQVDVTVHPQFKSFTRNHGGVAMTEHDLRKIVLRFLAAKRKYGQDVDTMVASEGVWLAYEATKIGRELIDRTGRLSNMNNEGSAEGFTFTVDGKTLKGITDSYVESGTIYMFKRGGNNWKRYVPPMIKGGKRLEGLEAFIPFEFIGAALNGNSSIQIPIQRVSSNQAVTQVTEGFQLPGMLRMQLVPDQPAGVKITNVAEDRLYSDN